MKKGFKLLLGAVFFAASVVAMLMAVGCSVENTPTYPASDNGYNDNNPPDVEEGVTILETLPSITPAAGDYSEGFKSISISFEDSSANIFFTTDGTDPSESSSRYTGEFKIIGSKTVKAIAILGNSKSKIVAAEYNLNAGKTQSQLGVVTGMVGFSKNLSESVRETLKNDTVYIYSDDISGIVKQCKAGETFVFDGLDTSKSYSFYFSNTVPNVMAEGKNTSRSASVELDVFGKPLVSLKISDITPQEGAGINLDTVELDATGTIKGVAKRYGVTGSADSDHSGISVFIPGTSYSAFTDATGNFAISGVPQGLHTIRATYAGYTFAEKENVLLKSGAENEEKDSTTDNKTIETSIDTEFSLYFGLGIAGGSVVLSDSVGTSGNEGISIVMYDKTGNYSYSATTATNGSWRIVDIYPARYSIEFSKDGYVSANVTEIDVKGAAVTNVPTVSLQIIGGSISGKAEISGYSEKSGISIIAENESGKKFYAITNTNGEFAIDPVSPGLYTVSASFAGYRTVSLANVPVEIGGKAESGLLTLSEKATYSIMGNAVLEGMESGFEGTNILISSSTDSKDTYSTTTNMEGVWSVSGLNASSYIITISRNGFITDSSTTVTVGAMAISVAPNVVLRSSAGTVIGNVTLEGATDCSGINILISKDGDSTKSYTTVTDSVGHFAVAGVTPGTYRVQATKGGYVTGISDPFTVSSGATSESNAMQLKVSLRSIIGKVTLESRADFTGVRITATKTTSTSEIYSALSNKDGLYVLSGMTPGEYILSYAFEGYRSLTSSSVSLANDNSLNLDNVELVRATGKISGIVNLEGRTKHDGIKVEIVGTEKTTVTNENGEYEFTVPSGNYPGGVKFSIEDFQLVQKAETIPVLTDSTYGVLTVELKAIANTVSGILDLLGSDDDSGIKVTIDGLDSETFSALSLANGSWEIKHVPLGYQTLRFEKVNVPVVTSQILVEPADKIDTGKLEIIPDSATLKGIVTLYGKTANANILVTVTTSGKDDIVVRTDATGAFEVTNVLSSGSHNVTFSKEGWNSESLTVSELKPLEVKTICNKGKYVLKDTTKPVLSAVVLNDGANFTNSPAFEVSLKAEDKGSGLERMTVQMQRTDDNDKVVTYPQNPDWQEYKVAFTFDVSTLPAAVLGGNDEYTIIVKVKDASGNISEEKSDSITLTDQQSILKGVLTGEDLHLTKTKSPYRVEANILCPEGSTLVIDPGVEVRFAGDYYLKVDGCIKAIGTADERIIFTKTGDCAPKGTGNWISCDKVPNSYEAHMHYRKDKDGNIIDSCYSCYEMYYDEEAQEWKYVTDKNGNYVHIAGHLDSVCYWSGLQISNASENLVMRDTYTYVSGNTLQYCDVEYAEYPLNKESTGICFINFCNMKDSCSHEIRFGQNSLIMNNELHTGVFIDNGGCRLYNNKIYKYYRTDTDGGSYVINNDFISLNSIFFNYESGSFISNNKFLSLIVPIQNGNSISETKIQNNVFEDCSGILVNTSESKFSNCKVIDFTHNYWGSANTEELSLIGANANASFITDYYDNFENTRVDYSDWATEPIENAGYLGDKFIDFELSINGTATPNEPSETDVTVSARQLYAQNTLTEAKFALRAEELKTALWESLEQSITLDRAKTKDGYAVIYAQTKDSAGNTSSIKTIQVAYDDPVIEFLPSYNDNNDCIVDGSVINGNSNTETYFYWNISDKGRFSNYEANFNGNIVSSSDYSYGWDSNSWVYSTTPSLLAAGDYEFSVTATDTVGNSTTKTITFTIERTVNKSDWEDVSYNTITGQLIKDDNTAYLWHFDGDGNEDSGNSDYSMGGFDAASDEGVGGAASYVWTSDSIPLNNKTNAITVEYWIKGESWSSRIYKSDLFSIWNYRYSKSNYSSYDYLYYAPDADSVSSWYSEMNKKSDGEWHHYAHVFSDTYMAVYKDGQLVSYNTFSKVTLNSQGNTNKLYVDMYQQNNDGYFDELRISNTARSADEIASYYKAAKGFYGK